MHKNKQSQLIENALLKWISHFIGQTITTFEELITKNLYLDLLSSVTQFKLIRPIKHHLFDDQTSQTFANQVANIKTIGQSIIRYYQTQLMRDISQMKINYVQLCMGNTEESIKLFSLVVGIFTIQQNQIFNQFTQATNKLQLDDQYIAKALMENAKTIGQIITNQESPLKKKILTKMGVYQEIIQNLQFENENLKAQLQVQKHHVQSLQIQIKSLKTDKSKLVQKVEIIEVLNSQLQSQNSLLTIENQSVKKKLSSQKLHYSKLLSQTQQKFLLCQKQLSQVQSMKRKIDQLKNTNFQLKSLFDENQINQKIQHEKFKLVNDNYKVLHEQFTKIQTELAEVSLEYQEFKYKHEDCPCEKDKNQVKSSRCHLSNVSQFSSLKYRIKDRLDSKLKCHLSQYQLQNSQLARKDSKQINICQSFYDQKQSFMNGKKLIFSNYHKSNLSNFIINEIGNPNILDIEDVTEFDGEHNERKMFEVTKDLDKSVIIDQEQLRDKNIRAFSPNQNEEAAFKTRQGRILDQSKEAAFKTEQGSILEEQTIIAEIISELYTQNLHLQQKIRKYQNLENRKVHRADQFKKQLKEIRKFEFIDNINEKFQLLKQKVSNNLPKTTVKTEKESHKNKLINVQSSGNSYPFYQMILN